MKNTKMIFSFVMLFLAFAARGAMAGTATVTWNANNEADLKEYVVYYGTSVRTGSCPTPRSSGYSSGSSVVVAKPAISTIINNLTEGQTYYFSVTAKDTTGNESCFSTEVSKLIPVIDVTAPTTPGGFTATAISASQINLSWTASTDAVGVTGYKIYRGTSAGSLTLLTTVSGATTYQNTGLGAATSYYYQVSAVDAASNEGARAAAVQATTQASAVTVPTCTSFTYTVSPNCVAGNKSRTVLTRTPANCAGGVEPVLSETCTVVSQVSNGSNGGSNGGSNTGSLGDPTGTIAVAGTSTVSLPIGLGSVASPKASVVVIKKDTDNDGLLDDFEIAIGTDIKKSDTDGDGVDDKKEVKAGLNPKGVKDVTDKAFMNKMKGKIFIQVEGRGEAWYVNTKDGSRYFLGKPKDAFVIMKKFAMGVNHKFVTSRAKKTYEAKYRGKIILDVEDKGKAYYIDIKNGKAYSLGSPANAFAVIRKRGAGIANKNLTKIKIGYLE